MNSRDAAADVLAQVCRDLGQLPTMPDGIALVEEDGCFHLTRHGDVHGTLDLSSEDREVLLVEIADGVQYLVTYNAGDPVWPVCPTHGFGLHPELDEARAAWVCRPHHHVVATIGHLLAQDT